MATRKAVHLQRKGDVARDARSIRSTNRVLRIVVKEAIDIHAEHQVLVRCELVVQTAVKQELPVMTGVIKTSIRR